MRQLTIRKIDDRVYQRLKDRARINHRSLEAEIRAILDEAVTPDLSEFVRRTAEMRQKLKGRVKGDVVAMIREDRDR